MPATFAWARGLEERPIELVVRVPDGVDWRVATQLPSTTDRMRFTAPDLAYFLDSPTEVSAFWERRWDVAGQSVGVALHHDGTEAEAEEYATDLAAIVDAASDIFGALPRFDYGAYTFLSDYLPWVDGDGMEHRNSTVLTSTGSLARARIGLLQTAAHEFFHAWNMERIRSSALDPFDFEAANMSRELWFGEGFTNYYDDVILWRAGLIDDEDFVTRMGRIVNAVVNARGRRYASPIEMSMQAPFVDAAASIDPQNFANTFLSYYTWGSGIALGLDLTLRTRLEGVTLDDLMREMWSSFGAVEIHYDVADIEAALARVSGDSGFARDFFDRFVRGRDVPDFTGLLSSAGVAVAFTRPDAAWLGDLPVRFSGAGATMTATPLVDTPLYAAGLDRGDVLMAVDGRPVPSREALDAALAQHRPGDAVELLYASRGETFRVNVTLAQDPALEARSAAGAVSEAQRSFMATWGRRVTR
jgi:predicted metalloprotease with PDZ domain